MAKEVLSTEYKDDVLSDEMGQKRRYRIIQNDDGTICLEDATEYTQEGDNYGAAQINAQNQAINESVDKATIIDSFADAVANTQYGMPVGALALLELNNNLMNIKKELLSQAETNGFSSNALLIVGTQNVPLLVTNTSTKNMPPDCKFGVREVISTSVYAIVKITGYSTSGVMGTWLRLYIRAEHKWYPWSSTSELYTLINNLRTDLVKNVNALVEYDKEFHSTADTTGGSFGKDFLHVDIRKKNSEPNKNSFWGSTNIKGTFVNYPPTMPNEAYGIREVFWCNSTNILVKLTETYPVPGRQYFRYYAGEWSAWKVVTPT